MTNQPHPSSFAPSGDSAAETLPATPNASPAAPSTPERHDGWTPAKQAAFLRELGATHNVSAAARAVGMGRQSAYKLRARLRGTPFDRAWEAAFASRFDALAEAALDRALNGVEVPHFYNGELIGTSRKYDERLTLSLLAMRRELVRKPKYDFLPEPPLKPAISPRWPIGWSRGRRNGGRMPMPNARPVRRRRRRAASEVRGRGAAHAIPLFQKQEIPFSNSGLAHNTNGRQGVAFVAAVSPYPNTATHCIPSSTCLPSAFHKRSRSLE